MTSLSLWTVGVGGRTLILVIGTLNLIVLARALAPSGRGQYFLFVSVLLVLATIADLGISQSAVVFAGRHGLRVAAMHRVLVRYAALFAFVVCTGGALTLLVAGDALVPNLPRDWWLGVFIAVPLMVYSNFWIAMMVGLRHIASVTGVQVAAAAISLAGNLAFVAPSGSTATAVLLYVAVLALQVLAMFWLQRRVVAKPGEAQDDPRGLEREMMLFGLRGYPNSLGMLLWSRTPVFVLNAYHGPAAVGVYSIAQTLAERVLLPLQSLQDLLYNRMTQLPPAEATQTMNRYLRIGTALILPIVAVAIVVSPALVTLLFSDDFDRAAAALRLLLVGTAVVTVPALLSTYFLGQMGRPGLISILSGLRGGGQIVLLLLLVPALAEVGTAVAVLTWQIIGTVVTLALYVRFAKTDLRSALVLRRGDLALLKEQVFHMLGRGKAP